MDFITHVQDRLIEALPEIIQSYGGPVRASSLSEMEVTVNPGTGVNWLLGQLAGTGRGIHV
jgi:hypothetical protein